MNKQHRRSFISTAVLASSLVLVHALPAFQQNDEWSKRDRWQRPEEVMDALGILPGSAVADVGCGKGYFVFHLARRVGPAGIVYGVDTDKITMGELRQRIADEKLDQVHIINNKKDDPMLPAASQDSGLDAVLIVNAYHEMREYDAMLRALFAAMKPGGRLAIIDAPGKDDVSRPTHHSDHTISESLVLDDASRNGFRLRSRESGFDHTEPGRSYWFFLLFEKP